MPDNAPHNALRAATARAIARGEEPITEVPTAPAVVRSHVVTGLDNKPYVEYQAFSEGYGIIAMGGRAFAERAALDFNKARGL